MNAWMHKLSVKKQAININIKTLFVQKKSCLMKIKTMKEERKKGGEGNMERIFI